MHVDGFARGRAPTLLTFSVHPQHGPTSEAPRGAHREVVCSRQHARLDKPAIAGEGLSVAFCRTQPPRLVGNGPGMKRGDGSVRQRRHGSGERTRKETSRDKLLVHRSGRAMQRRGELLARLVGDGEDARGPGWFVAIGVVNQHLPFAASAPRDDNERPSLQCRKARLSALQLDEVVDGIVGKEIIGVGIEQIGGIHVSTRRSRIRRRSIKQSVPRVQR